jgi:hypothetical protein
VPRTTVTLPLGTPNAHQQSAALPALLGAVAEDPLAAAVEGLHHGAAAHGSAYPAFFADARAAFPFLDD